MKRIDREAAEALLLMGLTVYVERSGAGRRWLNDPRRCTGCTYWYTTRSWQRREMAQIVHYDCEEHRDREFRLPEYLDEFYIETDEDQTNRGR